MQLAQNNNLNSLHQELLRLRENESKLSSKILDKLQAMESGRKYLGLGYSSLFDYLVRGLKYSESMAYQRQSCLRLTREMPEIKEKIEKGILTHSNVSLAYGTLRGQSTEQKRNTLKQIENTSFREAKSILKPFAPPVKVKQQIYKDKVILKMELTHGEHQLLEKLKALKAHTGRHNTESIFMSLVKAELQKFENKSLKLKIKDTTNPKTSKSKAKTNPKPSKPKVKCQTPEASQPPDISRKLVFAPSSLPRSKSKHLMQKTLQENSSEKSRPVETKSKNPRFIPGHLRNSLLRKAHYKCQYPGCEETHYLQIDHIRAVRHGGQAHRENLQVLCGAHNRHKG